MFFLRVQENLATTISQFTQDATALWLLFEEENTRRDLKHWKVMEEVHAKLANFEARVKKYTEFHIKGI